ncbi:MAG: HAMP domain-containing protein [Bacteroidetes bacterium]|nr:MAG: HAMP domain-containing protein [Bacteroidota bacterium]
MSGIELTEMNLIRNLRLRTKISAVIFAVAAVAMVVLFIFTDTYSERFILEGYFGKLRAIREIKADQIETYFQNIESQVLTFSEDKMVIEAMYAFQSGYDQIDDAVRQAGISQYAIDTSLQSYYEKAFITRLKENQEKLIYASSYIPSESRTKALQYLYIASNPEPVGKKDRYRTASVPSRYTSAHEKYHPVFRSFLEKFGYYDIFLVDAATGHVVYTVFKEVDFGTSLLNGPYRNSQLAVVFNKVRAASYPGFVHLADFAPYEPSYNGQASFMGSPIFDGEDLIGVLVFQMPIERINDIMTNHNSWEEVGLGKSGEAYLVGGDLTLRNQSRFMVEDKAGYLEAIGQSGIPRSIVKKIDNLNSSIGLQPVSTQGAKTAIGGQAGEDIFPDYRGIPVLSSFRPLHINGVQWAIMSEIDKAEALAPLSRLRLQYLIVFICMLPLILLASFYFSRSITKRLKALDNAAMKLAEGQLDVHLAISGADEISSLAGSFAKMQNAIHDLVEKQNQTIDALSASLIPVTQDVAVMPLIGVLDDRRIHQIRESLTEGLQTDFHKVVLLDVTGVPAMDEPTADGLIKVARAARLMGTTVILTGINPDMAAVIADLDIDLDGIIIENSMANGINEALKISKG